MKEPCISWRLFGFIRNKKEKMKCVKESRLVLERMDRKERDRILDYAKKIKGSSIRQIIRITGRGYIIIITTQCTFSLRIAKNQSLTLFVASNFLIH